MKKEYFDNLLNKLKFHHSSLRYYDHGEVVMTLTRAEIDDLYYIWKNHAKDIFSQMCEITSEDKK